VTSDGQTVVGDQRIGGGTGSRPGEPVVVALEPSLARELRIWSHRVTAEGWSFSVPMSATIADRDESGRPERTIAPGAPEPILVNLPAEATVVTLALKPSDAAG
jgi:hypothetical protein